ncbi:hypothetical protein [Streptomyces sp. PTY087I2]|uniref:hypothetical protein n=1 Tax=Streptomyces sp. PTY087I2 TaxID=1819298 RepID=UPI00080B7D27|nr:hypothetical protein [Streptomyces sp. PTY087I2]
MAIRVATRTVLAGLAGGVVGIAAYSISQTGGRRLSIVVGCLVGVALVLGAELRRGSTQRMDGRLVVLRREKSFRTKAEDMRQAAQGLFFQAATRVAIHPLDDDSNLREALTSLKTLFDLCREPLEPDSAPVPAARGSSVYELARDIRNAELAPFLAKWHPRLRAFEEAYPERDASEWDENAVFRAELRSLQLRLRPYVIGLGEIAGIPDPSGYLHHPVRSAPPATTTGSGPRESE